jgi:phosphoribosylanthranilate isomerase
VKARPNKLDPFAARLDELEREGKTLAQMQAALLDDGCAVSLSGLSDFLSRRRQERAEQDMFALIASGGKMNRELDAAFKANPAPQVERLIDLSKTVIMSLQVHGQANPALLKLASSMQATVLSFVSGQTRFAVEQEKLRQGDRKIKLLEEKAKLADQARGVMGDTALSEEQRTSRMRELFGMS